MHHFTCPNCSQKIDAPEELGGKQATCPNCTKVLTIPGEKKPRKSTKSIGDKVVSIFAILLFVFVARACGSGFGKAAAERQIKSQNEGSKTASSQSIETFVREVQSQLPIQVDGSTRADAITLQPDGSLLILYTILNNASMPEIADVQAAINQSYLSPEMKALRNEKRKLSWRYRDSTGRVLFNVTNN
jgi:hypothetical protein